MRCMEIFSFLTDNVPNESQNVTRKQLSEEDKSMVFKEKWILSKSMMINFIGNILKVLSKHLSEYLERHK